MNGLKRKPRMESFDMILKNFSTAAKGLGEYCPVKHELRVRKDGKTCRITCCEDGVLRFSAPAREEVVFPVAPDATVSEFRRCIAWLVDSR